MAILAETTIPRSLDLLAVRCLGAGPGRRVEAWLFEDEAVRRGVEERLRAAGIEARLRSAYKPLLHFFLEEASLEGVTAVRIRYPVHAAANPLRFRMEAYPLAGLLGCQSALNWDPRSARKRDPLVRCVEGAFRRGS